MTENEIWVEKYRPTNFNDIVLSNINRILFKNLIEMDYFPNLLFYGPPGTGKTTTIINLINEYQKKQGKVNSSTIIHLNASDERGIDTIRNQINLFVKSMNLFEKGLKFVVLDEVDYMTKNAQQALKYILQNSIYNVRFCLICNYISKIDDSLKNEFICVRFNQLPLEYIHQFLKNITEKEGFPLEMETIKHIQEMYGYDIRSMINFIQLNQNLNEIDGECQLSWKDNILTFKVFEELHVCISEVKKELDVMNEQLKYSYMMGKNNEEEEPEEKQVEKKEKQVEKEKEEKQVEKVEKQVEKEEKEEEKREQEKREEEKEEENKNSYLNAAIDGVIRKINDLSIQYNIERKTLLLKYFNWMIRNPEITVNSDFLNTLDEIIHDTEDVPVEIIIKYYLYSEF